MSKHKNKTVWLLVAIKGDSLLLKNNFHEGRNILQLPGSSSLEGFEAVVVELLGAEYVSQVINFGLVQNTIIKPDETVDLYINVGRIVIEDSIELPIHHDYEWCPREICNSDPRGKRDARLHDRLFENKPISLKYTEEQLDGWYNAKITSWNESTE